MFVKRLKQGSETEVTRDFAFRREASLWEPPQATIGLQRSFCRTLKAIVVLRCSYFMEVT